MTTNLDHITATPDAAADYEAGRALPDDDRPNLEEVVDPDGWAPGIGR